MVMAVLVYLSFLIRNHSWYKHDTLLLFNTYEMTSTRPFHNWPSPLDHVYILCDPIREPDRAIYLNKWLSTHSVASYTMDLACYGPTLTKAQLAKYNPWVPRKPVTHEKRNFNSYNLKPGEISLVLNWAAVAQDAVLRKHSVVMILESDVIFDEDFLPKLGAALHAIQDKPWDFLSISGGADLRPHRQPENTKPGWFPPSHPYYHTRTTDAMIFKVSMLQKIVETLFPFSEVLDWELNYQLTLHSSRSLWLDPPIVRQGSGKEYATTL